jgi:hypothetical protein
MNNAQILEQLVNKVITLDQAAKMLATTQKALTCKVSEKGCVSVYGLGRFPVALYAGQWERLIPFTPTILEFIKANEATISRK